MSKQATAEGEFTSATVQAAGFFLVSLSVWPSLPRETEPLSGNKAFRSSVPGLAVSWLWALRQVGTKSHMPIPRSQAGTVQKQAAE